MARPSNRRAETPPLTVRLSPSEREALRQKADRAGMRVSEGVRAALDAWEPRVARGAGADLPGAQLRNTP